MFNDWLLQKMNEMDLSSAELARLSGLTRGAISKYMGGRIPDQAALRKIAKGLKLPPEVVYREAGALPPKVDDPWAEEMNHKISQLVGIRREMAERLLNTLLAEQDREEQGQTKPALK